MNICKPTLEVETIDYLTNMSCNNKWTLKALPKLSDPRDAKAGSIQQNPSTYSKLLLMSIAISKLRLTFLCPL